MFSIRAEVYPTVKLEHINVTIFKTLDVSIFPGADYDLKLQITRSLSDFLHKYFSLEEVDNEIVEPVPTLQRRNTRQLSADGMLETAAEGSPAVKKKKNLMHFLTKSIRRKSDADVSEPPAAAAVTASGSSAPKSFFKRSSLESTTSTRMERTSVSNMGETVVAKNCKQEGLYLKYMRVGDINVDVSTLGFTINLDKFQAVMEPFVRRGQLLTWGGLIW